MLKKLYVCLFIVLAGLTLQHSFAAGHTVDLQLTHLSCYNDCDGKAKALVTGAAGPLLIRWKGNGLAPNTTGDSIMNLCPGTYTVEAIDLNDNSSTGLVTFEILNAPPFFRNIVKTKISCYGDSNGVATINMSGGTPPYRYLWSTAPNDTLNFIDSLPAGTYSVIVTDSNNCVFHDTIVMEQPDTLLANVSGADAKCKNGCDGSAQAFPTGGTLPYSYSWDNGDTNARISNLCVGTYSVEITDANSCLATDTFIVTEPDSLKAIFDIDSTACSDSCNGAITAMVTGGVRPYTYAWAPSTSVDSFLTGLCEGNYTFSVADTNGCFLMNNLRVEAPVELSLTDSLFLPNCTMCNGTIKIFPQGGAPPYRYQWDTGNPADTLDTLGGLCAGVYTVTVVDSIMCAKDFTFVLNDSSDMQGLATIINPVSCAGGTDGGATVRPVGGSAPYTYSWAPGGQTDSTIFNITAGTYFATATDSGGCKQTLQIDVPEKEKVLLNPVITPTGCEGNCDGEIVLHPAGGVAPYQFLWEETGGLTASESGLCTGWYHVKITDANGCIFNDSAYVDTTVSLELAISFDTASCYGVCNGSASAAATGGKPPYSYDWSNGSAGKTISGLCAGIYYLTVTDANGCQVSDSVEITSPAQILPNYISHEAACNFNDGKILLNPTGGAGNYSYLWFNGTTADSLTGLTAGVYNVQIFDTTNCSIQVDVPVSNSNGVEVNLSLVHVDCHEGCSGAATATPVSGQGPYRFQWSNGDTTASISGLCAGTHFVTVTDGSGCKSVKEVVLTEPAPIEVGLSGNGTSCEGMCDGNGLAVVSGGTPPYRYSWQNGGQLNAINDLCGGLHMLTVRDTNDCSVVAQLYIDEPEELDLSFSRKNIACKDDCNGELEAEVSGGTPPYRYTWSNGATTSRITALCEGTYFVDIEDGSGCMISDTVQVGTVNPPITAAINVTNAACGMCDGGATIVAAGGNGAPYTYFWTPGNYSGSAVTDLCAGIYTVTVTDQSGCSEDVAVLISNNGGPALTDTSTDVSCFGDCDGQAIVSATGNGPFTYFWNDPQLQANDTAFGLCGGNYQVIVADSLGCITATTVTVNGPEQVTYTATVTEVACIGDSLGAITVNVSGGAPPYRYAWSTSANDTLNTIDSLPAGDYYLTITDSLLCERKDTFTLSDPAPMNLIMSGTEVLCHSACNGTASVKINGGKAPYTISWNDPSSQTGNRAIGLCSGKYTATVTDANGCTAKDSIELVEPASFSLGFIPSNPTCYGGENGSITLNPTGGTAPHTYIWSNGQTNAIATGLKAGKYTVIGVDANGCTAYDTITLNNPVPLTANFVVTPPQCDSANGAIQATPTGGSGTYSYLWNTIPTKTTAIVTGIPAGMVEVTIRDNVSLCSEDFSVIVNNTGGPALTIVAIDESCFGACNGSADAQSPTATSYLWNDPAAQVSQIASGLCAGTYMVTVSDAANCKTSDTVTIGTTRINTTAVAVDKTSCAGDCDGTATVASSGGAAPYTYSWNTTPPQSGGTANGLCAGPYQVTVTDTNNCVAQSSITITSPDSLVVKAVLLAGNVCEAACDGVAEVMVTGGTAPYTFAWSDGQTSRNATGLCAGVYTVTVTDANGCNKIDSVELLPVSPILANAIVTKPLCGSFNGSIALSPSGGTGPYEFSWSNGASTAVINDLFAGIYTVHIKDALNCTRTFTFFLNNPNAPNLSFANNTVNCEGDCNGIARVSPVGGVAPYKYAWDYIPPSFSDSLTGLCPGLYSVKVTDAVGCIAFGNDTVSEPERLLADPVVDNPGCGGECVSIASANPSGGTAPYRFEWNTDPITSSNVATGLCAGTYQVLVTDTNNCVYLDSVTIVPPPALQIDSSNFVAASCNSQSDGSAAVFVSGGVPPYVYFWNNGAITPSITNVEGGIKLVEITDVNGCTIRDTIIVPVEDTVLVEAMGDFNACLGQDITLIATGTGVSFYQWFALTPGGNVQVGNDDTSLVMLSDTTTYVIRGTSSSSSGCIDFDTVTVNAIPAPTVDAGPDETILQGEGTVLDNVTPFIPQGLYLWAPGTGLDDSTVIRPRASPEETTTYVVTVIDELGCVGSDTITVFVTERNIIFSGFTPNGDGVNDVWTIGLIEDYPDAVVEIYNRWGVQVFRSIGYKKKWDGTYEGEELPEGTYYYVIDLKVEGRETLTGPITLMR